MEGRFENSQKYVKSLAMRNGFDSAHKYRKSLAKKRMQRPLNKKLSGLIVKGLFEKDMTQTCLAKKLGVSHVAVSRYTTGENIPERKLQPKLFKALDLPYKIIEDIKELLVAW